MIYKDRLPAIVGHTYLLRAVSFKEADVLVAFKVHRRDADGSLIIFWKLLERFVTPVLNQEETASSTSIVQTGETAATDPVLKGKIEAALKVKGFQDLIVDTSTNPMTLRGSYPKTKFAEVMSTLMEANGGKPVQNQASGK